jgi:hypothetical protein
MEHQSERWHWLEITMPTGDGEAEPWMWSRAQRAWHDEYARSLTSPEEMHHAGYRWLAVAKPPEVGE